MNYKSWSPAALYNPYYLSYYLMQKKNMFAIVLIRMWLQQ